MRPLVLAAAIGSLVVATPARADYVDLSYSGTILQLAASGVPAGIQIGTPITFNVVFDPAKVVDYTASVNSSIPKAFPTLTNPNFFNSYQTVSLSNDPLASLTVTVGGITFTKFDGINYGTPCGIIPLSQCGNPAVPTNGLGGGNLPDVEYINGSLAGVGNTFLNSQGYVLDADPTADILDRASGSTFHVMGIGGDYDFELSTNSAAGPLQLRFAAGDIDKTSFKITPVPEASTWSFLLSGLAGLLGYRLFRSRARGKHVEA